MSGSAPHAARSVRHTNRPVSHKAPAFRRLQKSQSFFGATRCSSSPRVTIAISIKGDDFDLCAITRSAA